MLNKPRHTGTTLPPPEKLKDTLGGLPVGSAFNRRALIFSLADGIFANGMLALAETFGIAAAILLKAPAIAISLLGSLPLLLSSVGQLLLPRIVNHTSRKHYVVRGVLLQVLFLFCTALSGYLPAAVRPWAYVVLFALYGFSGNVVAGFWIAWMGDLVPAAIRGRHFAWRNRIFACSQLFCALAAGFIARKYSADTAEWFIFAIVFVVAGIFRLLSLVMMHLQDEPPVTISAQVHHNLPLFQTDRSFLFYAVAAALLQGTVALAGPFFNVWYIKDLNFNYLTLSSVTVATILGTIISLPLWGKLSDTLGNRTIIIITVLMIATVPLPYIASDKPWQIWVLNFYTGFCWSGYNLSNFNYLLLAAGKKNSQSTISLAVALTGFAIFIFSLLGGILATRLPLIFHYRLHSLFFLSSLLRFLVFGLFFIRYPHYEAKPGEALEQFHQIPGYRAGMGILRNSFRAFRNK